MLHRGERRRGLARFAIHHADDGSIALQPIREADLRIRRRRWKDWRKDTGRDTALPRWAVEVDTSQQTGEVADEFFQVAVGIRNIRKVEAGYATDDNSEHLLIGELTALPAAEGSGERPEVHGVASVLGQFLHETGEVLRRSKPDTVHIADGSELLDVNIEAVGFFLGVRVRRRRHGLNWMPISVQKLSGVARAIIPCAAIQWVKYPEGTQNELVQTRRQRDRQRPGEDGSHRGPVGPLPRLPPDHLQGRA